MLIMSLSKDSCMFHSPTPFTDLSTSLRFGRDDDPYYDALCEGLMSSAAKSKNLRFVYRRRGWESTCPLPSISERKRRNPGPSAPG